MKKPIKILFVFFCFFINPATGQIIDERLQDSYDYVLLSPDCKLDQNKLGKIFTKLDIVADFPGRYKKWFDFARENFDFRYVAQSLADSIKQFQDSLIVKFVVTKEGNICNIKVQKGNSVLAEPAIKLLRSSPKWKPGSSGGRQLHSYRILRIDIFIDKVKNTNDVKSDINSYFRHND